MYTYTHPHIYICTYIYAYIINIRVYIYSFSFGPMKLHTSSNTWFGLESSSAIPLLELRFWVWQAIWVVPLRDTQHAIGSCIRWLLPSLFFLAGWPHQDANSSKLPNGGLWNLWNQLRIFETPAFLASRKSSLEGAEPKHRRHTVKIYTVKTCHSCPSSPATNHPQTSLHCRATCAVHIASSTSFGTAVAKGFSYDLPQTCHLLGGRRYMANLILTTYNIKKMSCLSECG